MTKPRPKNKFARVTDFNDQSEDAQEELVFPEDVSTLSDDDLRALTDQALSAFDDLYGDGSDLSSEQVEALESITAGVEALQVEAQAREAQAAERAEAAAALAARVRPATEELASDDGEVDGEDDDEDENGEDGDDEPEAALSDDSEDALVASAASGRSEVRVNLAGLRGSRPATPPPAAVIPGEPDIRSVAFASTEVGGFSVGQGLDFLDMAKIVDRRMSSMNEAQFRNAAQSGTRIRQNFGVATIAKPMGDFVISDEGNQSHIEDVLKRVTDASQMKTQKVGGSLVASGGWCAPSETIYDIYDCGEEAANLVSLPTIGITRGGIRFNRGVNFAELLSEVGFYYTEAQDIAGDYDGEGGGTKPCFKIPCIDFDEARLDVDGLCISGGLLQARGYPELTQDTIRKALIAHEIRMDSRVIGQMVAGSTAVEMPADQVGATAPLLTAIELQAVHYRSSGALADGTLLEGIFPLWTRSAIRADLSRRLGVDLISISNARIDEWFRNIGIVPQFVANWQSVATTSAAEFTQWPAELDFMLFKAGTWIRGNSPIITLENVYDSAGFGTNDYTALFTEEGVLTLKRGCDSRVVTVPICPNGNTGAGVEIACNGTAVEADAGE